MKFSATQSTQAKDAADDIDFSPDQYDDFELLEPEDFLNP